MFVTLTIIKYKTKHIPLAFFAMALHRLPLYFNKSILFYKLMGTGKNGTFDKVPDLKQWAILAVHINDYEPNVSFTKLYGNFITKWFTFFNCQTNTYFLNPIEGHGQWDNKKPFGVLPPKTAYEGEIAVLTRATIRINKLKYFWQQVAPVAAQMLQAKGFVTSYGVGEIPWIKQATFSIWESKADMKNFAYNSALHAEVIQKTRKQQWYSEDMFTRFTIHSNKQNLHLIN